ncbi:unnamed protein product, partial [Leptidea sinapis]
AGSRVQVPATRFTCGGRPSGYYADVDTGCQVYHMCDGLGRQFSYSCPNTTLFQQRMLVCDHWYMVNCSNSESDYDANLLIGQRDKPFVSEEEMRQRTPRPDILSVPPNNNFYDGLRESESKFSIHPGNSIVGIADSISNNNDLDSDKQNYRPPSSWSTGVGQRPTAPSISVDNEDDSSNTKTNISPDITDVGTNHDQFGNKRPSTIHTPIFENPTNVNLPSKVLLPPLNPSTTTEAYPIDIRLKNSQDPVYNFIKRFDPNSPDNLGTSMTKTQILDINKQLPVGQDSSEEDRIERKNKNFGNNINVVKGDKKKTTEEKARFDTVNVKEEPISNINPNNVQAPSRELELPKLDFPATTLTTTMGPPIYYQWKWAVPAFDLELPKVANFTNISDSPQPKPGKRPFSNIPRTTPRTIDLTPSNTEYNISSYFVPDYVFPLDSPHPGYGDEDARTSFQVDVSRPGRSSYGENPKCPHCHPAYVIPGTCEPCIVKG